MTELAFASQWLCAGRSERLTWMGCRDWQACLLQPSPSCSSQHQCPPQSGSQCPAQRWPGGRSSLCPARSCACWGCPQGCQGHVKKPSSPWRTPVRAQPPAPALEQQVAQDVVGQVLAASSGRAVPSTPDCLDGMVMSCCAEFNQIY